MISSLKVTLFTALLFNKRKQMQLSGKIKKIKKEAKSILEDNFPSHDWSHIERVHDLCMKIARDTAADREILKLSAYLHDVARNKQDKTNGKIDHAIKGSKIARSILKRHNYPKEKIEKICHCIEAHRFRNDKTPKSLEAKILFDADKLDSIGAIGIARSFAFVGEIKAKLYDDEILFKKKISNADIYSQKDTAYREFLEKLSKVRQNMQTSQGEKIAGEREQFMVKFFRRFKQEIKCIK